VRHLLKPLFMFKSLCLILSITESSFCLADTLKILATENFKPYSYSNNGSAAGIDYEINKELFKRLGHDVSYEILPWARQLAYAKKGLGAAILTVYCEDKKPFLEIVDEPFYQVKISLFEKNNKTNSNTLNTLTDIPNASTVGVIRGNFFSSSLDSHKHIKKVLTHATPLLIKQLHFDRLDYVLEEYLPFMFYSKQEGYISEFREAMILQENNVCTAFSKKYFNGDATDIASKASAIIMQLKAEGFIDGVIQKYIQ
jgi:ABC-type amino acid transport substrate-binding protein